MTGTNILLESRFKKGYTLKELSDLSGIPSGSITRMLHYESCQIVNLFKICNVLDVKIIIDGVMIKDYEEYVLRYKHKTIKTLSKKHELLLKETI